MERSLYFEELNLVSSPLTLLPDNLLPLSKLLGSHQEITIIDCQILSENLKKINTESAKSRAEFIRLQCEGISAEGFFESHRESWGIPIFLEDLVTVKDFEYGILKTFRDHTTSWCEDQEARDWFYKSSEAKFVRNYQLWSYDNGFEEIILNIKDNYKNILHSIIVNHADFSPLVSPVFTKQELKDFYNNFEEEKFDYDKNSLLEIIQSNLNW